MALQKKVAVVIILLFLVMGNYLFWFHFRSENHLQVPTTNAKGKQYQPNARGKYEFPFIEKYIQPCKSISDSKSEKFSHLELKLECMSSSEPCYGWHWDVANWTIIHTNVNLFNFQNASDRMFCPKPIYGTRTAKIVHRNGTVEYHDCPNDKYPCAPFSLLAGHFDEGLNMRINSSPCCRKQVIEVTQHMARVFDKHNITYLLVGGGVIGLARDGGSYVPYDTDLDVGVDEKDYDKLLKAIPDLQKPGYIFKWLIEEKNKERYVSDGRKWYMVGCVNSHCHTGPGIAIYSQNSKNITARTPPWTYPVDITVPPIRRIFEGMEMSFPKEPVKYLDFVYGKGKWETPLKCTKHYYSQCKA